MIKNVTAARISMLLACLALAGLASWGFRASAQAAGPVAQPGGRYVAVAPPSGPDGYTNFLWVLDTETGLVDAYRIFDMTEQGKHVGWASERIPNEFDLAVTSDKAQQGAAPEKK